MTREILIYAQTNREHKILNVVLELSCAAQELSKKIDNCIIAALLVTDGTNLEQNKNHQF